MTTTYTSDEIDMLIEYSMELRVLYAQLCDTKNEARQGEINGRILSILESMPTLENIVSANVSANPGVYDREGVIGNTSPQNVMTDAKKPVDARKKIRDDEMTFDERTFLMDYEQ